MPGESVESQFEQVTTRIVDLRTGEYSDEMPIEGFEQMRVAKNPATSIALGEDDQAKIKRRENFAMVYLIKDGDELQKIILPIRGYGLWSWW